MSTFIHNIDTAATGAAAMWVFMAFVWPRIKARVSAWVAMEAAKFTLPKTP